MNPFTIIIKNDTGIGLGTKVYNEKGVELEGVAGIHLDVVFDDANFADLRFTHVKLDVKATTRDYIISCSICGGDVDLSKPVKLFEGSMDKDGLFPVMCHKCLEKEGGAKEKKEAKNGYGKTVICKCCGRPFESIDAREIVIDNWVLKPVCRRCFIQENNK